MLLAVLSLIPVGLGLFLLAFGVPGRPFLEPRTRNIVAVGATALLLGPVAQLVLGFAGWLLLIGVLVVCVLLAALAGPHGRRALQE